MILIRDEFQCEPGRAKELVNRFKEMTDRIVSQDIIKRARILTDLSGRFDTVVVETQVESLDAYFAMLCAAFANPERQESGRPSYLSGSRAFYTIEATAELGA